VAGDSDMADGITANEASAALEVQPTFLKPGDGETALDKHLKFEQEV